MSTGKPIEKITLIRGLAIAALGGLFVADIGLDVMAKPVPQEAYWVLGAISLGISFDDLRRVALRIAGVRFDRARNDDDETNLPSASPD